MSAKEILCFWGDRTFEGSCNVCQRRDTDTVLFIDLTTVSVRLCPECAAYLRLKIGKALDEQPTPEASK